MLGAAIRAEGGLVSITDIWGRVAPVVVVIIDDGIGTKLARKGNRALKGRAGVVVGERRDVGELMLVGWWSTTVARGLSCHWMEWVTVRVADSSVCTPGPEDKDLLWAL